MPEVPEKCIFGNCYIAVCMTTVVCELNIPDIIYVKLGSSSQTLGKAS